MRARLLCLLLSVALSVSAAPAVAERIASPAGRGAMAPALATLPDGAVLLSWLEPLEAGGWTLRLREFDRTGLRWSEAREIARGGDWFANWADIPTVAPLGGETLMAFWFVENPAAAAAAHDHDHGPGYHARYSLSSDRGATWTPAQRITGESGVTEFVAAIGLGENERALVAWLDGRGRPHGPQRLYAQTFLASGPDQLVDASVCDCCPLALARTKDAVLLAYRGRTEREVRDIRLARWQDGKWARPEPLHEDGWTIAGCPVNGPRLAARGDDVLAVWYTAAGDVPRVLARRSRDGGRTFGDVVRLDDGKPVGRVDAVIRPDGSAFVLWLEAPPAGDGQPGRLLLRRVAADGTPGPARFLAPVTAARSSGYPRLALLGADRALVVHTAPEGIAALLVDLD